MYVVYNFLIDAAEKCQLHSSAAAESTIGAFDRRTAIVSKDPEKKEKTN